MNEDTTDYEAIGWVWSKEADGYVKAQKYKFRPGQTVWVWWGGDMTLRKATVIRFLYNDGWYQKWAVTSEKPDRPNGLATSSEDMYASHKEAVNKCRKALLRGIENYEGCIRRYVKALERFTYLFVRSHADERIPFRYTNNPSNNPAFSATK